MKAVDKYGKRDRQSDKQMNKQKDGGDRKTLRKFVYTQLDCFIL